MSSTSYYTLGDVCWALILLYKNQESFSFNFKSYVYEPVHKFSLSISIQLNFSECCISWGFSFSIAICNPILIQILAVFFQNVFSSLFSPKLSTSTLYLLVLGNQRTVFSFDHILLRIFIDFFPFFELANFVILLWIVFWLCQASTFQYSWLRIIFLCQSFSGIF